MAKEILTIHLGQAGVQMGNAMWELLCLEHNIQSTGLARPHADMESNALSLFDEVSTSRFVPRALLFDFEPTVIDEVRCGSYRGLWNPVYMINGKESAAALFARSYFSQGKEFVNLILENLRKLVNHCENPTAFQFINSFAGGTGSGMGALLMEKIVDLYGKKFRFSMSVFPSPRMSEAMVDPYNSILHTHTSIEAIDCNIICDNETLYSKCVSRLHYNSPTFTLINRIFAQMATTVFLSHRFHSNSSQHADVCELLTNLVPYPRIHHPVLAMAPIVTPGQIDHESYNVDQLTDSAFLMESQACECDIYRNKFISCAMLYRGEVNLSQIYSSIASMKANRRVNFVDWCPTGFKIAVSNVPPLTVPGCGFGLPSRSLTMVAGNLGIRDAWSRLGMKFDILFSKRSFVHHYVSEGMEEGEFSEARESIISLERDYTELGADSGEDVIHPQQTEAPPSPSVLQREDSSQHSSSSVSNQNAFLPRQREYKFQVRSPNVPTMMSGVYNTNGNPSLVRYKTMPTTLPTLRVSPTSEEARRMARLTARLQNRSDPDSTQPNNEPSLQFDSTPLLHRHSEWASNMAQNRMNCNNTVAQRTESVLNSRSGSSVSVHKREPLQHASLSRSNILHVGNTEDDDIVGVRRAVTRLHCRNPTNNDNNNNNKLPFSSEESATESMCQIRAVKSTEGSCCSFMNTSSTSAIAESTESSSNTCTFMEVSSYSHQPCVGLPPTSPRSTTSHVFQQPQSPVCSSKSSSTRVKRVIFT